MDLRDRETIEKEMLARLSTDALVLTEDAVPVLVFPKLQKLGIRHGCATRIGGVSEGVYAAMNLGFGRGDSEENVRMNFQRIADTIGFDSTKLVLGKQVHETNVRRAVASDWGKGLWTESDFVSVDAQITNEPGTSLAVFGADCVPILFYDPEHQAIGTAHAGWKGTIGRIAEKTVQSMQAEFGTNPSLVQAYIGPSICGHCYTVNKEVAKRFEEEFPEAITPVDPSKTGWEDERYLDLWEANREVLLQAGVRRENIVIGGVCTKCNSELLFSHRITGDARGNLACFIALSEKI